MTELELYNLKEKEDALTDQLKAIQARKELAEKSLSKIESYERLKKALEFSYTPFSICIIVKGIEYRIELDDEELKALRSIVDRNIEWQQEEYNEI